MLTCSTIHLWGKQMKLWKNWGRNSTIIKSPWDLRAPAALMCQPYHTPQIRHETKENFDTEGKKVPQWVGLNALCWRCRNSRSAADKTTFKILIWREVKANKFLNKTISPKESSVLWNRVTSPINLKIQTDFYPLVILYPHDAPESNSFILPSIPFPFLSLLTNSFCCYIQHIHIFVCLVTATPSTGNADNYNLMHN